jgi:iron complex transport system substrate-binding protein
LLKRTYVALAGVLIALVIGASAYGTYNLFISSQPSPSPSPTTTQPTSSPTQQPTATATGSPNASSSPGPTATYNPVQVGPSPGPASVTVRDARGDVVIPLPLNRIVCTESGITEIICALGGEDKIVGILSPTVNWPKSVNTKPTCGSANSADINLEAILDMDPQLVIFSNDTSAATANHVAKLKELGIAVYLDQSNLPERTRQIVTNFGLILNNQEKADKINSNTQYYVDLIQQRIQNAAPTRYLAPMGYGTWYCYGSNSQVAKLITACGGVNLFTNITGLIVPEAAAQLNPDVLIMMCSQITNDITAYQADRDEMMSRIALSETNAIKNGRVHVYNYWLSGGIEYPVGALCFAKWLHPDLFTDIDPNAVYQELIQEYFGVTPDGVYAYP